MKLTRALLLFWTLTGALVSTHSQTLTDSSLMITQIVSGLTRPIGIEFLAANDLLVAEKDSGQVRRVTNGVLQENPVLDLAVERGGELGLLSILKHPGFATNNFIYIFATTNGTDSDTVGADPTCVCVERYEWNGTALVNPASIFAFPVAPGVGNHFGGVMTFGPDGKLYLLTGDQEQSGPLQNELSGSADDTSVIVRLNDDGSVPTDNPLAAEGGPFTKYYAYGIRNSFGLAFDPVTGNLWDTENGPNDFDEINLVAPGFNSGWRRVMGPESRDPGSTNNLFIAAGSQYADPQFSWRTPVGVTGLTFLNSNVLGRGYEYNLFAADFNNGYLYRFKLNRARAALVLTGGLSDRVADDATELNKVVIGTGFGFGAGTYTGIAALKVGPDGKLYVVSYIQGRIYAIAAKRAVTPVRDLAITSLKAPKKITLKGAPVTKAVKVVIKNSGNQTHPIPNANTLLNLVNFTIESLGDCPVPTATLVAPKGGFPILLGAKKKRTIKFNISYDCINDGLTGAGHQDFRYTAALSADERPANDDCPRAPTSTDKKGCGGKGGTDVLTDLKGVN